MGARQLLHDMADAGLSVTADGDRLLIRPAALLTDAIRERVRAEKPDLLALLTDDRLAERLNRLLRWGWSEPDARALVERLARRDREHAAGNPDVRVVCAVDCGHYQPGRCGNHRAAGLLTSIIGPDLAVLPQRCPGVSD